MGPEPRRSGQVEWVWTQYGKRSEKIESVPVLTGLTTKNRLRVDWGEVVVVAQGQEVGRGCASWIWRGVAARVGGGNQNGCACA